MLNFFVKLITSKNIALHVAKHRQLEPILDNIENRERYLFLDISKIWNLIPFKTIDKRKHKIMYLILCFLNPKYILDINWISARESLYKVWTKRHPKSKFIVVQHGSYVGGVVTDIQHRYIKCDIFLTWGSHFASMFEAYNNKKNIKIVNFGNPIYNQFNRNSFAYSTREVKSILIAPSFVSSERMNSIYKLYTVLNKQGFNVKIKAHNKQAKDAESFEDLQKENTPILKLFSKNSYDLIITDHSSVMLDAIFFKKRVLFYSEPGDCKEFTENSYTRFLKNIFYSLNDLEKICGLEKLINIKKQEELFKFMIGQGNNELSEINLDKDAY